MTVRTVEKIGGTSMSRFPELVETLFVDDAGQPVYERIFVVSAYGGMTDLLLEHKHSGEPGVFSLFSEGDDADAWQDRLADVGRRMCEVNASFFTDSSILREQADRFVLERLADVRQCLADVQRICSFGPFALDSYLERVRELLSSMGEAHSAHNAAMLLKSRGIQARFVDLTGWRDSRSPTLDERIRLGLDGIDLARELPIVTGYAQCAEGLVKRYARGYTEITMSRIAALTGPDEAVIHKEYHLSSADPKIVGDASLPIGRTNYDVADQLANLGMEAIHPGAANMLRKCGIPLRIKHAFQPDHSGTLIDCGYKSSNPRVEIIAGRRGLTAFELFDQDMIGQQMDFETKMIEALKRFNLRSIGKDLNANSITHYVACTLRTAKRLTEVLATTFPDAVVESRKVAFVCAVGTDLDMSGILARCAAALADAGIPVLSASQPLRGVDARFVVDDEYYALAVKALHASVIRLSETVDRAA